jgi:hypothetical protein
MTTISQKDVIDRVAAKVLAKRKATTSSDASVKSATTPDGLSIEGQLRKWDPNKHDGLPMPLR